MCQERVDVVVPIHEDDKRSDVLDDVEGGPDGRAMETVRSKAKSQISG